jgi:hypothetical protein
MYVAFTYDGGKTWTTVNATPGDPVQRGCVWNSGGSNACRNLLDFNDANVDTKGNVVIAYTDGCTDACITDPTNFQRGTAAGLVRQSGGRSLLDTCKRFKTGCGDVEDGNGGKGDSGSKHGREGGGQNDGSTGRSAGDSARLVSATLLGARLLGPTAAGAGVLVLVLGAATGLLGLRLRHRRSRPG